MINASSSFILELNSSISEVYVKLELLDKNENYIDSFTTQVCADTMGDISVDATRDIRRMFTLTLDNSEGKFTWKENGLIWIDNKRIKLYMGLKTPIGIEYIPQGVFIITSPEATHKPKENTVTLSGQDKWYLLTGNFGKFTHTTKIEKDTNIKNAIKIIANGAGIPDDKMILDDCDIKLPFDVTFQIGDNRGKALKELTEKAYVENEFFYDIYFDVNGYLRFEKFRDPLLEAPCWTYKIDNNTLYAGGVRKLDDAELFNHILTLGGHNNTSEFKSEIIIDEDAFLVKRWVEASKLDFDKGTFNNTQNATNRDSITLKLDDTTRQYALSGTFISQVIDISNVNVIKTAKVDWTESKREEHTVKLETNVSLNGGTTWIGWKTITVHDTDIPDLPVNTNVANAKIQYKVTLTSTNVATTPSVGLVSFELAYNNKPWVNHPYSIQKIGDRMFAWNSGNPDGNIDTQSQADARSLFELKKKLSFAERVTLDLAPNYLHEENDVIEIIDDANGCTGNYQLKSFNIPIKPKIVNAEAVKIRKGLV